MRQQVFHEGVERFVGGRLVGKGALKLPPGHVEGQSLPVVLNFVPSMIIAWATDMKRDEDGRISFEIEFITPRFQRIYGDLPIGPYANNIKEAFSPEHNHGIVVEATLRALSFFDATSSDMGRSLG
jgi:hypothetical protein